MDRQRPCSTVASLVLLIGLLGICPVTAGCRPSPSTSSSPPSPAPIADHDSALDDTLIAHHDPLSEHQRLGPQATPPTIPASASPGGAEHGQLDNGQGETPIRPERSTPGELAEERWYALYYGVDDLPAGTDGTGAGPLADDRQEPSADDPLFRTSRKIGHMQLRVARQPWGDRELVRTDMLQRVSMQRYQQQVTQQIVLSSLETDDGRVLRMRSQLNDGGEDLTTDIRCDDSQLHLTVNTLGQQQSSQTDWQPEWRGFFAEYQTLKQHPLAPGETRELQTFVPVLNMVGTLHLEGVEQQWIETPFGREQLLRVESRLTTPQIELDSTLWVDDQGIVRKYVVRQGSITAYQTVRAVALAPNDLVDLYEAIQIQVASPIPLPHEKRRAVYRVQLRSGRNPADSFFHGPGQQIRSLGSGVAELTVLALRPNWPAELAAPASPPTDSDLSANSLIQTDDMEVRRMAGEVFPASDGGDATDPWEWAVECERYVHRSIERKVLTEAFRTAAEVARSRQGDCTEHAVLLAALCRVRGIPARVVTGLVAVGNLYGFHMWNEVWIRDRWIPLDATLARGGIGAGHLKLSDSSLDGVSPFSALAPVLSILGDVELEVVSYE